MNQFSTLHGDAHPLSRAEYLAVLLLDPAGVDTPLAMRIIQARRLKVATKILAGIYAGEDAPSRESSFDNTSKFALGQADALISCVSRAAADLRQNVLREAAELIRAHSILNTGVGPQELRPRLDGDRTGLAYAYAIERLADIERE